MTGDRSVARKPQPPGGWGFRCRQLTHREIEMGIRERLALQREVPPFLDKRLEATPGHGFDENGAVCLDLGADAAVSEPRARAGKVVESTHVELALIGEPH